jgi:Ni,Fe-hydrogenase III component G
VKIGLEARFPELTGKVLAPRERRAFVEVPLEAFRTVFEFAVRELHFDRLCTITGMDDKATLSALYSLSRGDGWLLSIKTRVPSEKPVLDTVTDIFPGSANYERELVDLLGFEVCGVPPGRRYPLPESWPVDQKPLRKDWKPAQTKTAS